MQQTLLLCTTIKQFERAFRLVILLFGFKVLMARNAKCEMAQSPKVRNAPFILTKHLHPYIMAVKT